MAFTATKEDILQLPNSKRELAMALYKKCCFQEKELTKLQSIIKKDGWTEGYQNGANQSGRKKTAEADSYLSLAKVFNSTVKQLNDLLKENSGDEDDGFLNYVNGGKKAVIR